MDYIHLVIGAIIGFNALTYAWWLKQHGNQVGAISIMLMVLVALALPLWRIVQ